METGTDLRCLEDKGDWKEFGILLLFLFSWGFLLGGLFFFCVCVCVMFFVLHCVFVFVFIFHLKSLQLIARRTLVRSFDF